MTLTRETAPNRTSAEHRACELAAQWRAAGERPVVLVPTRSAVHRIRAGQAGAACSFGAEVAVAEDWAADRWELAGDGRAVVSGDARSLLVRRVLAEAADAGRLAATLGTAEVAARLAREHLPAFERMQPEELAATGLAPAEREMCAVLASYAVLLRECGLIEPCQVFELLPELPLPACPVALAAFDDMPPAVARLARRWAERAEVVVVDDACTTPSSVSGRAPELDDLLAHLAEAAGAPAEAAAGVGEGAAPGDVAAGVGSGAGGAHRPSRAPVQPTGAVRFVLPSGPSAAPRLIAEAALRAVRAEDAAAQEAGRAPFPVVIAARDPKALFEDVAGVLAAQRVPVEASARVPFAQTPFGRTFLPLSQLVCGETWSVAQASDAALGPLSGIPLAKAHELDAAWRGNRLVTREWILRDLTRASKTLARAAASLSAGDFDGALAALEDAALRASESDAADRAFLLAAAGAARRTVACAAELGFSAGDVLPLLEDMPVAWGARATVGAEGASGAQGAACAEGSRASSGGSSANEVPASVPASVQAPVSAQMPTEAQAGACVRIVTLDAAAELAAGSAAAVVVCDLTSAAYPVRTPEDAATAIASKLGLSEPPDALAAARRRFFRALDAARTEVLLERPLNAADAAPAYAAVVLEELVDCYREDATSDAGLDRATGLPRALVPFASTAGEDALLENLSLGAQGAPASWPLPETGQVSKGKRSLVVLPRPRKLAQGAPAEGGERDALPEGMPRELELSASAIESYLECPYKWFALRRLHAQGPDAGFGPLEMGSFSHGVLKSFYTHFQEDLGLKKVKRENVERAKELLAEVFDRHLAFQGELRPSQNPLVPRTALEQAEVRDLARCLDAYLDRECELLPGFTPTHFEFSFGDDGGVPYAGSLLRGSVDRIDVDAHGNAVIIDYKGKLSGEYDVAACSPVPWSSEAGLLPHKVQALIYAQVVQRVLGYRAVGGVYVSYGRNGRIHGAFDRTVVGEEQLPGIKVERCGVPGAEDVGAATFGALVDQVENGIACALGSLAAGSVAPCPRGSAACNWCPVTSCERRGE